MSNEELLELFLCSPENRRVTHQVALCVIAFATIAKISEEDTFNLLNLAAKSDIEKNRETYLRQIKEATQELIDLLTK